MPERELRLLWWVTAGALLVGLVGSGIVWVLYQAMRHYTHSTIAVVLLLAFLACVVLACAQVRISVKEREP